MASVELSYYYGYEAEQFSFYRIPKLLFTDSRFAGISTDAKLLYGILLDLSLIHILPGGGADPGNRPGAGGSDDALRRAHRVAAGHGGVLHLSLIHILQCAMCDTRAKATFPQAKPRTLVPQWILGLVHIKFMGGHLQLCIMQATRYWPHRGCPNAGYSHPLALSLTAALHRRYTRICRLL